MLHGIVQGVLVNPSNRKRQSSPENSNQSWRIGEVALSDNTTGTTEQNYVVKPLQGVVNGRQLQHQNYLEKALER